LCLRSVVVYFVKLFNTGNKYKINEVSRRRYDKNKKNEKLHKFEKVTNIIK
jgi:hypothetical protein